MWAAAALVHFFTALGAVCGLLATLAVVSGAWETAFAWLGLAMAIDGIDGTLARKARVQHRLPRFSGDRLDLVIDYVTYVFVPAFALLQAGFLAGRSGLILASLILLSSLFHFSDTKSKAADHSFVGFPAVWNLVAFYVFALGLPQWAAAALVLVCVALTFVPFRWAHPLRTARLRTVTLAACAVWTAAAAAVLWSGFPADAWAGALLLLTAGYGIGLTLYAGVREAMGSGE
ncbi:MAG TPA: CDP-alcohol phosphatidyltransferase family protein [Hyphomicrobiaceae bacterium]|jgi:phosphatidylcholine synthase|nr:CDP-alcohol phosphatidyltransferase family protein [Hyphomicrobiaceae bacterium]